VLPNRVRLATIRGTPITADGSTIVLALWIVYVTWQSSHPTFSGRELAAMVVGVPILMVLSIVLHELGHVGAARLVGIRSREISLHALGGFAFLDESPTTPWQRIFVSVSGPLVNLAIWFGLSSAGFFTRAPFTGVTSSPALNWALYLVAFWNLWGAIVNLAPAPPLDGGRISEAVLWKVTGSQSAAARVAARIGIVTFAAGVGFALVNGIDLMWILMIGILVIPHCLAVLRGASSPTTRIAQRSRSAPAPVSIEAGEVRDTVTRAKQHAREFGKTTVGTADLLVAIAAFTTGPTAVTLRSHGVAFGDLWDAARIDATAATPSGVPRLSREVEHLVSATNKRGLGRAGLFLGLGAESDAATLLGRCGVSLDAAQRDLTALLQN